MLKQDPFRLAARPVLPWLVLGAWLVLQPSVPRDGWRVIADLLGRAGRVVPSIGALMTPAAGLDRLPPAVRDARTLLHEAGTDRFRIAEPLASDDELTQRLIESAWPIRIDPAARVTVLHAGTPVPPGCRHMSARGMVALARCD